MQWGYNNHFASASSSVVRPNNREKNSDSMPVFQFLQKICFNSSVTIVPFCIYTVRGINAEVFSGISE